MSGTLYKPSIGIHPGRTLRKMLESLEMSQTQLAERSGLALKTINEIVQEKASITPETAMKFAAIFNMSAAFWNSLQRDYENTIVRLQYEESLKKESKSLEKFYCYSELVKLGMVPSTRDPLEKTRSLLGFFGVSSLSLIRETQEVAFRKTGKKSSSNESVAAWLRCGELLARDVQTKPFDAEKLSNSLGDFRKLTLLSAEDISIKLREMCADLGIALIIMPHFKNTGINAATRWLSTDKALMQLTLRWRYSDVFWFNFFHEIGHILKHGKKDQFIEFDGSKHVDDLKKEEEADDFASNILIPKDSLQDFLTNGDLRISAIKSFSSRIGVSDSVVAGRVGRITGNWPAVASLRSKFSFKEAV